MNTSVKIGIVSIIIAVALSQVSLNAQAQHNSACNGSDYRAFDFWIGDWAVTNAQDVAAGSNLIEVSESGCLLLENWTSANGGTGKSMNYWDPVEKLWKQVWVSSNGSVGHFKGNLVKENVMVLQGDMLSVNGTALLLKGTWSLLDDGRVRQHFEQSTDEGATWSTWFDGYYARKSSP